MTREKIDTLLKWLDKLGLGANDEDAVRRLQLTRADALPLASASLIPLCRTQH